jgi:hypothetical protein
MELKGLVVHMGKTKVICCMVGSELVEMLESGHVECVGKKLE